ncbi:cytochrome c oxidase subunit 2 [Kineococcus radiotolerans]|uniref:Cytochrome c oxidase subunit 2 n=1 Tax=Kineococcus radiotolerans TaxID=131568 RepID=A0A7W4TMC1_KINRA|nr:cytochrome c oxidase subunit II [Kineococcus radiotolerans]MBB2901565.1 cytochrome c oxidase subunit 2 [Kineococcus radiotolerans]
MGTRDSGATRRRRPPKALLAGALTGVATMALTGCAGDWPDASASNFFLPDASIGATNQTERISVLWDGSWIAALVVGVLVWALTIWCVVAYRRRKSDPELPAQVRYNMPIEILYTIVPVMMVGVLFYYTARDQQAITDTSQTPDVTIEVVGKKWSWDFNYLDENGQPGVYDTGRQADLTGVPAPELELPTLYLPVDQRVQFDLYARDVNHSFWVPAFLMKMDLIAGSPNHFQVTPTKEGTFLGECAELCGEYHSEMLFNVKVVSQAEYQQHLDDLQAAGQTGSLPTTLAGAEEMAQVEADSVGEAPENAEDETSDGNNS